MNCSLSNLVQRYIQVHLFASRKLGTLISSELGEELTLEQNYALRYLSGKEQCTVSELAVELHVKPSAVTAQMNRLVARGYVNRLRDEKDRRVVYLSLSEKGLAIFKESEEKMNEMIKPYLEQISEDELKQFILTYEKLEEIIRKEMK
ncbi:MarR family winged helix-turn-helix transcriptional regulator [Bacillus horti]|uniref:DNA-binding MarR family transcriptional regulator n=1 Tax=Caldalkalibacillus horti TaxID=77523 RepID=A0ABT9VTX8_9BACI|nr:MarR family transcriptional regulator [Bacillus horti]MDQ0164345.1 DNA-binding MarR family transcriptional regulator [Bacillus horti]